MEKNRSKLLKPFRNQSAEIKPAHKPQHSHHSTLLDKKELSRSYINQKYEELLQKNTTPVLPTEMSRSSSRSLLYDNSWKYFVLPEFRKPNSNSPADPQTILTHPSPQEIQRTNYTQPKDSRIIHHSIIKVSDFGFHTLNTRPDQHTVLLSPHSTRIKQSIILGSQTSQALDLSAVCVTEQPEYTPYSSKFKKEKVNNTAQTTACQSVKSREAEGEGYKFLNRDNNSKKERKWSVRSERLETQNQLLREEVEYLRDKFTKCLIRKYKPGASTLYD